MDVLPGPTGVTRLQDETRSERQPLLVCGWVEVFVGSRGEVLRSGVFVVHEPKLCSAILLYISHTTPIKNRKFENTKP